MTEKIAVFDDESKRTRSMAGIFAKVVTFLCIVYTFIELAALQFVVIDHWVFIDLVLIIVFILGYMTTPFSGRSKEEVTKLDWFFMAMGIAPCIYILTQMERLQFSYGAIVLPLDIVAGVLLMASLFELVRRTIGWSIPIVILVFLAYAVFGHLLPTEFFGHRGLNLGNIMGFMMGPMAIAGRVMSAMVTIIFLFMLFSTFIQKCGAGIFLSDVAQSIAGRYRGGPAKVAVFSSSFFGTISGSSVANVAVDGGITIPLMVRTGFTPAFAAAEEATASTGGQIMPPIMGAGAFIMAELLNVPYGDVIVAAAIPAVLFYVALYCMTDLEALKQGGRGLPKASLPQLWRTLKEGWHLLIPVVILLYQLIIIHASVSRAGFLSIAAIIVFSWFRKKSRLGFKEVIEAIREGALNSVTIASLCAAAGIIEGVISMTGLGIRFGSTIIPLSGGYLSITLLFTAALCLLISMGLPTTASYIVAAAIGVPALVKLGVAPIAAHLFVFYFACMSAITPPQCGAIFAAIGFSKTRPIQTGWIAMRLAFPGYIVPFVFIYHPVLLMEGSFFDIGYQFLASCIGVAIMSMGLVGTSYYGNIQWSVPSRLLFAVSFFAFIIPVRKLDMYAIAAVVLSLFITTQTRRLIIKGISMPFSYWFYRRKDKRSALNGG